MSLISDFRDCVFQAGQTCGIPNGRLIRDFGLQDLLENVLEESDDPPTITVKGLTYFCQERTEREPIFRCAVLAVGLFLKGSRGKRSMDLTQPLRDLLSVLQGGIREPALRGWVASNFP